jgi:hypothetical protein
MQHQGEPMYAMHGQQAPGFYGPSMTFPAPMPIVYGSSPPPIQMAPPMMYTETPLYTEAVPVQYDTKVPVHPQIVHPVIDDNHPSHRALLWGGLLSFFSTATFANGMLRFLQAWPTVKTDGGSLTENDAYFPPIVSLIAGIFAIVIGLVGFLVGLSSILHQAIKPGTAMAAFGFMALLASYVFVIEVFAQPIFEYTKGTGGLYSGFIPANISRPDRNSSITFSTIFCLFSYFFTSVGMILLTCLELKGALAGALESFKGAQMKQRIMSFMVFFNGLAVLVLGCIIYMTEDHERLMNRKWIVSPNFVEFPAITVMTGIFLILYSAPGFVATVAMAKIQGWLAIPMFLWMVAIHWLTQISHFGNLFSYAGAWMGLLSLMNIAAPAVYGGRVCRLAKYIFKQ